MAAKKRGPRTNYSGLGRRFFVTLSPYAAFIVQELAKLQGISMSAVLRNAANEYVEANKSKVEHAPAQPNP